MGLDGMDRNHRISELPDALLFDDIDITTYDKSCGNNGFVKNDGSFFGF